jgi:hypothetical protein
MPKCEEQTAAELFLALFILSAIAVCIVFNLDVFLVFVFGFDRSRSFQDAVGIECCRQAHLLQTTEDLQRCRKIRIDAAQ